MREGDSPLRRLVVALIFIPFLYFLIKWDQQIPFLLFVLLATFFGEFEFYSIMEQKGAKPLRLLGLLFGGALIASLFWKEENSELTSMILTLGILLVLISQLFRRDLKVAVMSSGVTLLGVFYVAWLFGYLILIRKLSSQYLLTLFLITWLGDSGAYVFGRTLGRHTLIPRISPHKSVEGVFGGILLSLLAAFLAKWIFCPDLQYHHCLILGLFLGGVGIGGDLSESLLKRDAKVKDTSSIIPGYGGVLDTFDSLLFTAPAMYYYFKFFIIR